MHTPSKYYYQNNSCCSTNAVHFELIYVPIVHPNFSFNHERLVDLDLPMEHVCVHLFESVLREHVEHDCQHEQNHQDVEFEGDGQEGATQEAEGQTEGLQQPVVGERHLCVVRACDADQCCNIQEHVIRVECYGD